jgi:hypothetical protein
MIPEDIQKKAAKTIIFGLRALSMIMPTGICIAMYTAKKTLTISPHSFGPIEKCLRNSSFNTLGIAVSNPY